MFLEHLFITLNKSDLFGLFLRAFVPGKIKSKTNEDGTIHYRWSYVTCPPPETSPHALEPFLLEFAQNIYKSEVPDEPHYVVKKYLDDIVGYAERMFDNSIYEDEEEEEEEEEDEYDYDGLDTGHNGEQESGTEGVASNRDNQLSVSDGINSDGVQGTLAHDRASHGDDSTTDSEEDEGTFGEIANWSFTKPDLRFSNIVNDAVAERLKTAISGAEAVASFCCGGKIAINPSIDASSSVTSTISAPVIVRFDTSDGNVAKVVFDGKASPDTTSSHDFDVLLQQCQPASFGVGGQEVHDQTYRDAVKMDTTKFTTNIHPYDLGILHVISKTLLPQQASAESESSTLRAELYKLNVYSGPSGKFKAHVDTPRSEDQLGSLVICLPMKHEGGSLIVRQQDRAVAFDWGASTCIQYAAFFSDLEHEVKEVTAGHRVTLTYNLFWTAPVQKSRPLPKPATVESLPLYGELQKFLGFRGFLAKGGLLGLYCTHSYVHNRKANDVNLPHNLKGVDLAFFGACKALGLDVFVRPVRDPKETDWFNQDFDSEEDDYEDDSDEGYSYLDDRRFRLNKDGKPMRDDIVLKYGYEPKGWKTKKAASSFADRLDRIKRERVAVGAEKSDAKRRRVVTRVGGRFGPVKIDGEMMCDDFGDQMSDAAWERLTDVIWLNKPRHNELQKAYLAYGNEPSLRLSYTYAAIFVRIPDHDHRPDSSRSATVKQSKERE